MTLPNTADIVIIGGGVRYQFSKEINVRLLLESLPMLERFKEEIWQEINYRQCDYLIVCTDDEDAETFKRISLFRFEDANGGTFNQKDGLMDPNSVVAGYISATARQRSRSFTNVAVIGIKVDAYNADCW